MDMSSIPIQLTDTVGSIVTRQPALSRVFEEAGIDYCCGGKISLADACAKKGLDPAAVLEWLVAPTNAAATDELDPTTLTLTALADHIVATHHAYLKAELPRLEAMTRKVAAVHGAHDARLAQVRDTFAGLFDEMAQHMMKEEQILFPLIRRMEAGDVTAGAHCGSIAHPIAQMEHEHQSAGNAVARLRELTDGFTPPDWACNTYRAMLDALAQLEQDLHQHVHKENNILFPRAAALEAAHPA
jgi:regulator of cell morphogenesis and NO signaling